MKVTIHDIAKIAHVSHTTVSRVINNSKNVKESTRKKIFDVIDSLDYIPSAFARGLSKNESNIIGLVVPEISNPFFAEVIQGVTEEADKSNMVVFLFNTDENAEKEERILRILQEHRIEGLIITPVKGQEKYDKKYVDSFVKMKIPTVLVDRNLVNSNFDGVFVDDAAAMFDATKLLLNQGHRDVVILGGNKNLELAINRVNGYKRAYKSMNLEYNEKNIYFDGFTMEAGYNRVTKILKTKKWPTAFVASNNMLTLGCLKAIYEQNIRIPDDIGFVGYDKIDILNNVLKVNITTIEKDAVEMGKKAMQMILNRLENKDIEKQSIMLSAKAMIRGSEQFNKR